MTGYAPTKPGHRGLSVPLEAELSAYPTQEQTGHPIQIPLSLYQSL